MGRNLSYVLVTPYTIAKSRTGGVLSRLLTQTDLELVGAQIITLDEAFVKEYADSLCQREPQAELALIAEYVEKNLGPSEGRKHRSLLLLFRGEAPCKKLLSICGPIHTKRVEVDNISAETIRATYADLIFSKDNENEVSYFEPAVLTPRLQEDADSDLLRFASFLEGKANIIQNISYTDPSKIEQTLVILKPDNWSRNSSRPGAIIDMFSRTGLRIVGIKIHRFSMAEALGFYGPVEEVLKKKLAPGFGNQARELLEKEFNLKLSEETARYLAGSFGIEQAKAQFADILEFMSGKRPDSCPPEDMEKPGDVKCMIIIYEGEDAISKIRDVLGPTDPLKAPDGTVRREFGSNVMVNSAHASDSKESYDREKAIVKVNENSLASIIRDNIRKNAS
jgi:nucleoside diphosphate kinase